MNIFSELFGIFRNRGLVSTITEGRSLKGFTVSAIIVSILGGLLYGFAMGIGLGIDTAVKDALKVALIVISVLLFSIPIFWLAFRLLGREEKLGQVAAIPLTMVSSVSIILAATSPIVFLLSVLVGFSPEAIYIHIVIVDVAILLGLYLTGTLIYHSFSDQKKLVIPSVVGFLMMGVILVVLVIFFSPFLALRPTFSVGTDRLKDGLGIGVATKARQALSAAEEADRVKYRFQTTNENKDLVRDYSITRLGNDYLVQVHLHAIPNEDYQHERRIWIIDGQYHTDFDDGKVVHVSYAELANILEPALPPEVFNLPPEFSTASWRGLEIGELYKATGRSANQKQALLEMGSGSGRLYTYTLGSAEEGLHAESRVKDISPAEIDIDALEASLNQAIVLGDVDHSDASMNDYAQEEVFFVVRYPRTWKAGSWNSGKQKIEFTSKCGAEEGCSTLAINVFDLEEGKGAIQYAEDLGRSLDLQPEYRVTNISPIKIGEQNVGIVEYFSDKTEKREIITAQNIEYIFEGENYRYHLAFSASEDQFEINRELFEEIAELFTYLKPPT